MKNSSAQPSRFLLKISALCLLPFTMLSSCIKDNSTNTVAPPAALVSFAQTSPDEVPISLFFNQNSITNVPLNYGNALTYFTAFAGKRTINIYNTATTNKILADTVDLTANKSYSMYLANIAAKAEIVLLKDSLTKPDPGKGTIRFINLSPDAGPVDLAIKDSAAFITNKAFKEYSTFIPLTGGRVYNMEIRKAGTTTVLATMSQVSVNSGYVYTIDLQGLVNTSISAQKVTGVIVTNGYSL